MRIVTIVLGALLVVGGVYCMVTPVDTYAALGWLIGVSMVIDGVGDIVMWNARRKLGFANGWTLAAAIVSLLLGVFLVGSYVLQFAVDVFIAYLIAAWLVVAGIVRVVVAISMRNDQEGSSWVIQLVLGVLIAVLGVLCIYNPLSIAIGVGLTLGMSIALVGAALVAGGLEM